MTEIARDEAFARQQRDLLVGGIGPELLALYDKLRRQHEGVGAVAIKQRRCDGCRLEMTPTDLGRIRAADDDLVLRCEECRRIQVRTIDSGL
jgi:predicted  nucleic acid-binding Zn-ribbon protein